ncbi:MAG: hypothetical protein AVO33_05930 [delta proteobacterium ML8_F1]|nr:MAG: hypothetical protein AVO33_05930 [delta proteobacterium ML8_F1]
MKTSYPVIGFIGLGTMGKSMARNLIAAGYSVNLYNRSPENLLDLVNLGGTARDSPMAVAKVSEIVLLSLPDSKAVESVVYGEKGLLEGLNKDSILVDMTTSQPQSTRKIAEDLRQRGIHMLDAPVSGGPKGAAEGTLSIMVGGDEKTYLKARPLLEVLGKKLFFVGPAGSGHTLKVINNLLYGTLFIASCEAVALGVKAGIEAETLIDVISSSSGHNHAVNVKFKEKVLSRDFSPGFTLSLLHKDMTIALELAESLNIPLETTANAYKLIDRENQGPLQSLDHSALIQLFEKALDIEVKKHPNT